MTSKLTSKLAWEPQEHNQILEGDGFYISYNRNAGTPVLTQLVNALASMIGEEERKDGEETALYIKATNSWLILEGDWREQYEQAFPHGLEACKKVFYDNITHRSNWSTND